MKTLEPGQIFAEKYRVVRCIAAGGMGAVYEVVHEETQRALALKVLLPTFFDRAELRDRFRTEARITAPIQSDAIVQVYDAGVEPESGMPFLTMELLRGEPLDRRIQREGRLTPGVLCTCLMHLAHALDKTHAAQIVHRDLKPENLFVARKDDGTEQVKILDFGLAKIVEENAARGPNTSSVGTPLYMAPEQFHSGEVSPATDLYAVGMLAYTMLVGTPYWNEEAQKHRTLVAFAMVVAAGPDERASVRAARAGVNLPRAFDAWFSRMTAVDPSRRPSKATVAIQELAEVFDVLLPAGLSASGLSIPGLDGSHSSGSHAGTSSRHATAMAATLTDVRSSLAPTGSRLRALAVFGVVALLAAGWWLWSGRSTEATSSPTPAATWVPLAATPAPAVSASPAAAASSAAMPAAVQSAAPESSDAAAPRTAPGATTHPTHAPAGSSATAPPSSATGVRPNPLYTRE